MKHYGRYFYAAFIAACAGFAPQGVQAESGGKAMTYQVYAGGINAVTAKLDMDVDPHSERYDVSLSAFTRGFLGRLVPWSGTFETAGWQMADGSKKPEQHRSTAVWRQEEEVKTYSYGKDGRFQQLTVIEDGKDKTPDDLDNALADGTVDALTATLEVMKKVGQNGRCEGSSEVFDGSRRFEMVFSHEGDEHLTSSRYNIYEGAAARCVVEVKPIAGRWHSKPRGWLSIQEQGRDKGLMPTVWMASIDENSPAVPVRVQVRTDYGTLLMHLTEYQNGDTVLRSGRR